MNVQTTAHILRWIARVWSIVSIITLLMFFIGEGVLGKEDFNLASITLAEWVGLALFPGGVCLGMILAWWREGTGGAITVGSLLAFYLVDVLLTGTFPGGIAFAVFAMPGPLFLGCWLLAWLHQKEHQGGE